GYILNLLFGHQGMLGEYVNKRKIKMIFNWNCAVLAAMIDAFPLLVRPIRMSFQMINRQLEQVAGSLGATPWRVFCSISLPLASPGFLIGSILSFIRSLGASGASITFVGNIPEETRSIPIAMYILLAKTAGLSNALRLVI